LHGGVSPGGRAAGRTRSEPAVAGRARPRAQSGDVAGLVAARPRERAREPGWSDRAPGARAHTRGGESAAPPGERAARRGARHPKKSDGLLRQGCTMRFAFIQSHARIWHVRTMCRVLEVSRAGYYAWRARPLCERVQDDRVLTEKIREIQQRVKQ